MVRGYFINAKGEDKNIFLRPEHTISGAPSSLFDNRPSKYTFEAILETHLLVFDHTRFRELAQSNWNINQIYIAALQENIQTLISRVEALIDRSPEQRYEELLERIENYEGLLFLGPLKGIDANLLAKAKKLNPQVVIEGYAYSGSNPQGELLLGPAYTLTKLLNEADLKIEDIDVFEIHEAFAGQVLANLAAIQDEDFCKNSLGLDGVFGEIPMDKINTQGGSLSLGHPFGATGSRLLTSATRRLIETKGKYALISACAAGGLGSSILLKRVG